MSETRIGRHIKAARPAVYRALLDLVLGFVEPRQAGMASGVISTLQQVGAALGVAAVSILFSSVLTNATAAADQAGLYASAFVRAMLYNLAAAVLAAILLMRMIKHRTGDR
ncbi:hypothetical protein [Bradyrhizobium sp. WD16]|uniref:hypothetical protein n=1 Tax=Bradyrhizobium sp. WD16 TaxID=1521768 RepID=UPI0020A35547|nr:hypothetical protein [Bradyrhizobium sp. WD16]UTD25682.1 hypothetical protein DB459_00910 [Bradyrhizobium sp. WD16]